MSEVRFTVGDADAGLAERLDKEISAFNAAVTGHHDGRMLSVAVRGDDGDLHAGLYGWTWGGCGYIDLLWVRDDQRGSGLGARLLATAEAEIRRRGCDRVALNTHSFQAPGFYARFGYRECGRTPGYPHGHNDVTVIGEEPSVRTHEIRDILARNSVPFGFYRSDSAEGRQALARLGVDQPAGPVVALFNRIVLVDPGSAEVAEALGVDVQPARPSYDVIIVGAGPAGLAAAVYAASEGLATVLLELEAFGGQAGTSSRIRNYLGFPHGISGAELAWRAYEQAWTFGTHFIYGNPAISLAAGDDVHVVGLKDGSQIRSRAVIIATGVSYRRLGIVELESLAGAGVFYGASTIEAQAVAGKPVFVVGGGNSAGQAALHLAKYAAQVTLLVRSPSLAVSMSDYLMREIGNATNVRVRYRSEVAGGGGDGRLEYLLIRDRDSGRTESQPAAGLFILIGAQPFTGWLPGAIARDQWGFILTGPDAAPHWLLPRAPFLFETTTPGVFAVGDVRHGSVKRVASAVGEGSIVIRLIHDYLALTLQTT